MCPANTPATAPDHARLRANFAKIGLMTSSKIPCSLPRFFEADTTPDFDARTIIIDGAKFRSEKLAIIF